MRLTNLEARRLWLHNHTLWSRNRNAREKHLWPLLKSRQLFAPFPHGLPVDADGNDPHYMRMAHQLGDDDSGGYDDGGDYAGFD